MRSIESDAPRAYVTSLPSTPEMARYTAAPSAYTDPTVQASPTAWWGSSLSGCGGPCGCGGCGGLGAEQEMDVAVREYEKRKAQQGMVKIGVGAALGYFIYKKSRLTGALVGAAAAALLG
jgi:hypothetical protein